MEKIIVEMRNETHNCDCPLMSKAVKIAYQRGVEAERKRVEDYIRGRRALAGFEDTGGVTNEARAIMAELDLILLMLPELEALGRKEG